MRQKIFKYALLLSAAVLVVFGIVCAVTVYIWYSNHMENDLLNNANLIANQLSATATPDYNTFAIQCSKALSARGSDIRTTIVARDGTVLGDSAADYHGMESHKDRPEIMQALQSGRSHDIRYSNTLHVNMMYVALYPDNSPVVVRLATPMYMVKRIYLLLGAFFLAGVLLSLAVAAILAFYMSKLLSRPLETLKETTNQIALGNYAVTPEMLHEPEFAELSNGLIKLSRDLDTHVSALKQGNIQLTSVLSSITEGLIALDEQGRLLFINAVACNLLGIEYNNSLIGCQATQMIHIKALTDLADECIHERKGISSEISIPWVNPLLLQATASPMQGATGCLLLLVDITQLRKLEHMRRDFVANVTHELRTPLTSIRGYVETLQSGAVASPELSAKFLEIIEIEAERLSNLIGDMLYLSEIENNMQDTGIRVFRLSDVAQGVAEMLEFGASARNIKLVCDISDSIFLEANPDRIKQLLLNLADNAVKYNQEGGSVTISAERTTALARISVKDTGIGISEEHVSRIFERFYRVDKGRSRSMGGTGLGLSIVKHIVDLYRGNIRLISELGRGTEFIIELPLKFEVKKKS